MGLFDKKPVPNGFIRIEGRSSGEPTVWLKGSAVISVAATSVDPKSPVSVIRMADGSEHEVAVLASDMVQYLSTGRPPV